VNLVSCGAAIGRVVISKPDEYITYISQRKNYSQSHCRCFKEKKYRPNVTIDQKNHRVDSDYVFSGDWRTKPALVSKRLNWKECEVILAVTTEKKTETGWEITAPVTERAIWQFFSVIDFEDLRRNVQNSNSKKMSKRRKHGRQKKVSAMLGEFKNFAFKGNVVDLGHWCDHRSRIRQNCRFSGQTNHYAPGKRYHCPASRVIWAGNGWSTARMFLTDCLLEKSSTFWLLRWLYISSCQIYREWSWRIKKKKQPQFRPPLTKDQELLIDIKRITKK